ncbi:hypothetical protein Daus18300_010258 [Diaporthe australafricana]|uniref:Major facilitator superfamily (MFS) profile domain-containing protein n=1 Tax=Diaporthe australafricana TaxID=127596 RepID=A0ABR3WB80_9PEZI
MEKLRRSASLSRDETLKQVISATSPSDPETNRDTNSEDTNIVDWDGPNDPENPLNWPNSRKWTNLILMSLLNIISPLGSSMFAPGVAKILVEFNNTSSLTATFVVSIYVLGFAFGPLVAAPMSEMFGRVYVYHVGNIAFTIFSIAAALSPNMNALMAFRFLMGLVDCVPTTIGVGSIVDMVVLEKRGRAISLWAVGPLLGPCVGPVAGGYLIKAVGWRWVYWLLAIMGGVFSILAFLIMRESYAPVLLERKVRRLRVSTGNPLLRSKLETKGSHHIRMTLIRPFKLLLATPLTFGNVQDYLVRTARKAMSPDEEYRPEVKLTPWLTVPTSLTLPVGLFIYGWTTQYQLHWIIPMIGVVIFSAGLTGITANDHSRLPD